MDREEQKAQKKAQQEEARREYAEHQEQERQARTRAIQERKEEKDAASRERRERQVADYEAARQRRIGIAGLAFRAGFYGALGVAVASVIIGVVVGIFWLLVLGAIYGAL